MSSLKEKLFSNTKSIYFTHFNAVDSNLDINQKVPCNPSLPDRRKSHRRWKTFSNVTINENLVDSDSENQRNDCFNFLHYVIRPKSVEYKEFLNERHDNQGKHLPGILTMNTKLFPQKILETRSFSNQEKENNLGDKFRQKIRKSKSISSSSYKLSQENDDSKKRYTSEKSSQNVIEPILPPRIKTPPQINLEINSHSSQKHDLNLSPSYHSRPINISKSTSGNMNQSLNQFASEDDISDSLEDFSFSSSHMDYRIHPFVQNGVKMSDTHYFILSPRKHLKTQKQIQEDCTSNITTRATLISAMDSSVDRLFNGRPTCFLTKLHKSSQYLNVDSPMSSFPIASKSDDSISFPSINRVSLRRGLSESYREPHRSIQNRQIDKMHFLVPMATEKECQAILIGSSWNFPRALRRLKLELVFRTGCVSKLQSQQLLDSFDWNLDSVLKFIGTRIENVNMEERSVSDCVDESKKVNLCESHKQEISYKSTEKPFKSCSNPEEKTLEEKKFLAGSL